MADKNLISTKKCPSCQQWSQWQQQADDRCEHCGELLDPRAHAEAQQQVATEQQQGGIQLMEIGPDDTGLVWFFKTIVRGGQLLFIAILGFIVWLVTAIAG
jgi:phage FluMu protein Com